LLRFNLNCVVAGRAAGELPEAIQRPLQHRSSRKAHESSVRTSCSVTAGHVMKCISNGKQMQRVKDDEAQKLDKQGWYVVTKKITNDG
jgi:hypothetical protein